MARLVEEVRVDVERHAHARVPEDAADPHDVEVQVDDQVAGEGVPKVVKAQAAAVPVEAGGARCVGECAALQLTVV